MKSTIVSVDEERQIIINLIISTEFAKKVIPSLQPKQLKSSYAQTVAEWVQEYFREYQVAPKSIIEDIFRQKRTSLLDEEQAASIAQFLESLSQEYESGDDFNPTFAAEQAITYLKCRSLEILASAIVSAAMQGNPLKGEAAIANFSRIGKPEGNTIDILHDSKQVIDAFTLEDEALFTLPGVLRETIGPFLRGDLSAWIGKPKGKKSFALMFSALEALAQGLNVAFFSWEMRDRQLTRRAWQGLMRQPVKGGVVEVPEFEELSAATKTGRAVFGVRLKRKEIPEMDLSLVQSMQGKFTKQYGDFRMYTFPAYSATVEDMVAALDSMAWYDGFVPDVVMVDYADIIRPSKGAGTEYRHQLDSIWKGLRALAQARNIHVMTASQTNRAGLKGDIELENIAEDMRKLTHVSLLLALNQTTEEKEVGIMRIKTLLNRDNSVHNDSEATILQSLALGRFYIDSRLTRDVRFNPD